MEHLRFFGRFRNMRDRRVLVVCAGVTLGSQDDGQCSLVAPFRVNPVQCASGRGVEDGQQITFQAHHQHLAFWIAEAHVVFNEFRALGGNHQSSKEHAGEGITIFRHARDRRLDDFFHGALHHGRGHYGGGRIGTHAARIRTGITITDALVILRGCERQRGLAVGKAEEARFLAIEEGLHHHFGAGRAESAVEAVVNRGKRFRFRHGHGHALAGGKPVGLDDDGRTLCADVVLGRLCGFETLVSAGRNIVARAEILRETLGTLQLRCRFRWPESGDAGGTQVIRQTGDQRRFRADDDEVDCLFFCKGDDGSMIFHVQLH